MRQVPTDLARSDHLRAPLEPTAPGAPLDQQSSPKAAYENRKIRFHVSTFMMVAVYVVALFLFGVWGLYGLTLAWASWLAFVRFRVRR